MSKLQLVFATNNQHKLKEVQSMLTNFELLSLKSIGCNHDIEETATTLEGNAKIKADYITTNFKFNCFADDTGLEVEALDGKPGVYSARYAGKENNAENNLQKLLSNLKNNENRKAQFRTVVVLNLNGKQYQFEGNCKGVILKNKQGNNGFGYDPIFKPDGYKKSFAEMNITEKGLISHRGKAIKKLVTFLNTLKH